MNVTPRQRKALLKRVPWITYSDRSRACDGILWGKVPLYALHPQNGQPRVLDGKYRCKVAAHWKLTALRKTDPHGNKAATGTYCQHHLWQQISHSTLERDRLDQWMRDVGEDLLTEDLMERSQP